MNEPYRILTIDPYVKPFEKDINLRMQLFKDARKRLGAQHSLSAFANGHHYYGFHPDGDSWVYREWAPGADHMALVGDFNGWDSAKTPLTQCENGNWEVHVKGVLPHLSKVRIKVTRGPETFDRIPLYILRTVQDAVTGAFDGVIWSPEPYKWQCHHFKHQDALYIYECHIGMAGEKEGISTFADFRRDVLPRVKSLGYTAIQIMAVMEHPYYGSFGYQVSNFFAVSSRFGTPEDFKALVDDAHQMGIAVIMDLVHSHMVKNTMEGPSLFDGTDEQFCHAGAKGDHPAWKTRLFNYRKPEVLHFLLSNVKYWLEAYRLDGFRFDGVTSMLYHHHGLGVSFNSYSQYFSMATDTDAVVYLQLATALAKEIKPDCIMIAEDMSGLPGMCLKISDGGLGFDYRLNMGLPDFLIKLMKLPDENWDLGKLWYELTTRRPAEKAIGYAESHDQALVGDKTMMFWLADKEMYWHMQKDDQSPVIDRAMSLHKMLRFITCAAGGDGYLNFMGNEFGHPEWVDFPREGNGWSYQYCRRQWHLADDPNLKFQYLLAFDKAMLHFLKDHMGSGCPVTLLYISPPDEVLAFTKGDDTFVFNFHPTKRYLHRLQNPERFKVVFHTARKAFGGYVDQKMNDDFLTADGLITDRRTAAVIRYER